MVSHGALAHEELVRDCVDALTIEQASEDFTLAGRQLRQHGQGGP
jgi:hypothetical protein